jgi:hypothetical protein
VSRILEPPGTRFVDRPKPGRPGVIERTYLDGGQDVYGSGAGPAVVEGTFRRTVGRTVWRRSSSPAAETSGPLAPFAVRMPAPVRARAVLRDRRPGQRVRPQPERRPPRL